MAFSSALMRGRVMHRRLGALTHRFDYGVYMLRIDLDDLTSLGNRLRLLGVNAAGVLSLRESDHLDAAPGTLRRRVEDLVRDHGVRGPLGRISLVTNARVLGYVFNPVSFFVCQSPAGDLAAIVCEVNNTFGEHHVYVLPGPAARPGARANGVAWHAKKVFHVSPFYSLDGTYRFEFDLTDGHADVRIDLLRAGAPVLVTRLALDSSPLTDGALVRALARFPLMTLQVIAAIHWEAFKLWLKGAKYHPKPAYDPSSARQTEA